MKIDKLYLKPVGGLCNRMRAVDTAASLARQSGKQLIVFWGRDIYLNCRYSDLFESSEHFKVMEEKQFFGKKALFPYLPGSKPTSTIRKAFYSATKAAFNINQEIWFENFENALSPLIADVTPERIKSMQDFESKSYSYFSTLLAPLHNKSSSFICTAWKLVPEQQYSKHFTPVSSLNSKVYDLAKNFINTVGVHIRRSDHEAAMEFSTLQKFTAAMDAELKLDSTTTFFLATDCRTTEENLRQLYPGKIFAFPKASYNRNTPRGIKDAVVDLYALSKTNKILGSYYSSFSQVAAEISGIEEVTVY